jgi:hypothetical protein
MANGDDNIIDINVYGDHNTSSSGKRARRNKDERNQSSSKRNSENFQNLAASFKIAA